MEFNHDGMIAFFVPTNIDTEFGYNNHRQESLCIFLVRVFFKLFHQNHDRFAAIVKRRIFEANRDK